MSTGFFKLTTEVPCIQGYYGERLATYATQLAPTDIKPMLGHDPRALNWNRLPADLSGIYRYLQRPTSKSRREGVMGYIEERFGPDQIAIGAFPSISIAFSDPVDFRATDEGPGSAGVGKMILDLSPLSSRILIDGLGRVTGILDLIDAGEGNLLKFHLPVTVFAPKPGEPPLTWKEMGQLFHDFNFRVQPVPQRLALALDTADQYIQLARDLTKYPFLADYGGVAERVASLGGKSTELVVQTVWVRAVRGACEGRKFQEAFSAFIENPNFTPETEESVRESIADYFQSLSDEMGTKWTARDSLHLTSPGWQALGVIHHDIAFRLKLERSDRSKVIKRIAQIDWSRYNEDWLRLGIGLPETDKMSGEPIVDAAGRQRIALTGSGRTNTQALIDYMREKAGLSKMLKDAVTEPG